MLIRRHYLHQEARESSTRTKLLTIISKQCHWHGSPNRLRAGDFTRSPFEALRPKAPLEKWVNSETFLQWPRWGLPRHKERHVPHISLLENSTSTGHLLTFLTRSKGSYRHTITLPVERPSMLNTLWFSQVKKISWIGRLLALVSSLFNWR